MNKMGLPESRIRWTWSKEQTTPE